MFSQEITKRAPVRAVHLNPRLQDCLFCAGVLLFPACVSGRYKFFHNCAKHCGKIYSFRLNLVGDTTSIDGCH